MVCDRDLFSQSWILLTWVLFLLFIQEAETHCSRPLSRIVRNQLREHFFSVLESKNQEPYSKCPLHLSHDLYRIQEGNKTQEYASKWVCNFCGKAFVSERYLDKHFDNRHSDKLVKGPTVCLADFCDIFRCEVFENQRKDNFWEKKLCKEDKLRVRRRRCEALMRSCLPQSSNLSVEQELEMFEVIGANTCSLLNCKDYWKQPRQEIPAWKIILYATVTPFFFMALIVYYYGICDYYYGDFPLDTHSSHEEEESFSTSRDFRGTHDLRRRYGGRPLMY